MPGGTLDKYVDAGDTALGGGHKYTFSGFGNEGTPYWRKKAEREALLADSIVAAEAADKAEA